MLERIVCFAILGCFVVFVTPALPSGTTEISVYDEDFLVPPRGPVVDPPWALPSWISFLPRTDDFDAEHVTTNVLEELNVW